MSSTWRKNQILCAGLEVSSYIARKDDTIAHKSQNGYCTLIGNELFAPGLSTVTK